MTQTAIDSAAIVTKHLPLQTLLDLSQLRMEDAARKLGELLAGEQEAGARLALLQQYREEYHGRLSMPLATASPAMSSATMALFLGKLDDAIVQAQHMVAQSRQRTAQGQQEWIDKRGRVQTYDTLSQRHRSREQGIENRQQQKILNSIQPASIKSRKTMNFRHPEPAPCTGSVP